MALPRMSYGISDMVACGLHSSKHGALVPGFTSYLILNVHVTGLRV